MNSPSSVLSSASLSRTQIYLSSAQHAALAAMARHQGSSSSAVIRQAIDEYIEQHQGASKVSRRLAAAGQWAANKQTPDLRQLRSEERSF
jgi:predicted transcriptional regulator